MERIILEVDKEIALAWQKTTKEQRAKVSALLRQALGLIASSSNTTVSEPAAGYARPSEKALKNQRKRAQLNFTAHMQALDKASDIAEGNGLNPAILDQLLGKDE